MLTAPSRFCSRSVSPKIPSPPKSALNSGAASRGFHRTAGPTPGSPPSPRLQEPASSPSTRISPLSLTSISFTCAHDRHQPTPTGQYPLAPGSGNHFRFGMARGRRVGGPGLKGTSWTGRDLDRVPSPGVCRRYRPSRVSSHHGSRLRSRTAQIKTSVSSNV